MYYPISLEGYQIICVRSFSFAKGQQVFESINQSIYSQDHPKRLFADMKLRNYPKPYKIYLYNYHTKTAIFLATKREKKTIMACTYLNLYKYFLHFELLASNTIKNESIHLNSWHHSHKKQKDSLETQIVLLIFSLKLEISGVAVQRIHQNSEKWYLL